MRRNICRGICTPIDGTQICSGCFRHYEEITRWFDMSDQDYAKTLLVVQNRKTEHESNIR